MRILLQKVSKASVTVDGNITGTIEEGYLLFLGVMEGDTKMQAEALARKICALRLFPGEDGKINDRSLLDVQGSALVVSQFTLAGRTEKGNRPDYTRAAAPKEAEHLYDFFIELLREADIGNVATGVFGGQMRVELVNEGPVTLMLER